MVSFKSLAILSVFTLGQQSMGQVIDPIVGLCEQCGNATLARFCTNRALNCCYLQYDYAICLPQCPTVVIVDPPVTPIATATAIAV
ncbi:hypothetical protein BDN72DRAFT_960757 [Pluteus cervinus]|uniref:Uncharacterized protein n=1 Tax=Pluteus cervinus TaxID=181527 RepID=A0ACD3APB0_9AGAR|nr:hypothetical protein BDN72DRAFT_960757 [Pluteus cervinus]